MGLMVTILDGTDNNATLTESSVGTAFVYRYREHSSFTSTDPLLTPFFVLLHSLPETRLYTRPSLD